MFSPSLRSGPLSPKSLATTASADFSLRVVNSSTSRRPFRPKARSPQVMTLTVPARAPDLRSLTLDRESFTVFCPLALVGHASYPIPVRRPAGLATPLLSTTRSRSLPCGSLGSLRSTSQRTYTSKSVPMLGTQNKGSHRIAALISFCGDFTCSPLALELVLAASGQRQIPAANLRWRVAPLVTLLMLTEFADADEKLFSLNSPLCGAGSTPLIGSTSI